MATSQGVNVRSGDPVPFHSETRWSRRFFQLLSTGIHQVLRYSALFFGVFYGFYHQSSLNAKAKIAELEREYHRKEQLIEQAKAAFAKRNDPKEPDTGGTLSISGPPGIVTVLSGFPKPRIELQVWTLK